MEMNEATQRQITDLHAEVERRGQEAQLFYERMCEMGNTILQLEQEITIHKAEIERLRKFEPAAYHGGK